VTIGVVCLTLLGTAQDAVRRATSGAPMDWPRSLEINALDWVTWALFVPLIVSVGRRNRLDDPHRRLRRVGVWIALGVVCCAADALITGVVLHRSGLIAMLGGPGVRPPLGPFLVRWLLSTVTGNTIIFCMIEGVFHAAP